MGSLFPKAPAMPSADEQYATQKRLTDQAQTEATTKAEKERRKGFVDQQRKERARKGYSSLVTSRTDGGLLGIPSSDQGSFSTLFPNGE